jgi:hypothetical protein
MLGVLLEVHELLAGLVDRPVLLRVIKASRSAGTSAGV